MSPPHLERHVSWKDFEIIEYEELQVIFKMALIFYGSAHHGGIEGTLDEGSEALGSRPVALMCPMALSQ